MPPEVDAPAAQSASNNSSDFVRKLYKMLEDPTYNSVVRWSADGDSFVVLENEKFTKTILPKHFKHSNFASFVRQLNKYDFHKVRHNEEGSEGPYGRDAWEFRHPEFRSDRKDNLDNIRRKAPAPRKAQQSDEAFSTQQQLAVLGESLAATQQQIQQLQEQYFEVTQTNRVLVSEVLNLQKMTRAQSQASNEVLNHLNNIDAKRRTNRHSSHPAHANHGPPFHSGAMGLLPDGADEPAPELRRAREILNGVSSDSHADRELERLSMAYVHNGSTLDSATSSLMYTQPNSGSLPLLHDHMTDMRHVVYPVGQTTGIDPFHSDHIHNIPYSRPLSNPNAIAEAPSPITSQPLKDQTGSLWGAKKPRILLVEDDKTCSKIGDKFLTYIDCTVEVARDGLEAVEKCNHDSDRFDLIFMDIIMPHLDGVSATAMIRVVAPRVPIIAMTSNIRQEDIQTYFSFGMNDVLAKPFTRDGMIRILKKHLTFLLKDPLQPGLMGEDTDPTIGNQVSASSQAFGGGGPIMSNLNVASMAGGGQVKFESTPIHSPATTSSWRSPSQMTHTSPNMETAGHMTAVGSGGLVLTPGGNQRSHPLIPHVATSTFGRRIDAIGIDSVRPEKRQCLYGQLQTGFV